MLAKELEGLSAEQIKVVKNLVADLKKISK
jgi:hypothetical protein